MQGEDSSISTQYESEVKKLKVAEEPSFLFNFNFYLFSN